MVTPTNQLLKPRIKDKPKMQNGIGAQGRGKESKKAPKKRGKAAFLTKLRPGSHWGSVPYQHKQTKHHDLKSGDERGKIRNRRIQTVRSIAYISTQRSYCYRIELRSDYRHKKKQREGVNPSVRPAQAAPIPLSI